MPTSTCRTWMEREEVLMICSMELSVDMGFMEIKESRNGSRQLNPRKGRSLLSRTEKRRRRRTKTNAIIVRPAEAELIQFILELVSDSAPHRSKRSHEQERQTDYKINKRCTKSDVITTWACASAYQKSVSCLLFATSGRDHAKIKGRDSVQ